MECAAVLDLLMDCYPEERTARQIAVGLGMAKDVSQVNSALYGSLTTLHQVTPRAGTYPPLWSANKSYREKLVLRNAHTKWSNIFSSGSGSSSSSTESVGTSGSKHDVIVIIDLSVSADVLRAVEPYCHAKYGQTENSRIHQVWAFAPHGYDKHGHLGYPLCHTIRVWMNDMQGVQSQNETLARTSFFVSQLLANTKQPSNITFLIASAASAAPSLVVANNAVMASSSSASASSSSSVSPAPTAVMAAGYQTLQALITASGHVCHLTPTWDDMKVYVE